MIENFDSNWYKGIASASCLSTTKQMCYSDNDITLQPWAIIEYCNSSMNMLTEDICYDWYVNSIYPETPKSGYDGYYNSTSAILAFDNACNEYPWHDKCKCKTVLKEFNADSFTTDSDPSQVYNASCLFPSCTVGRKSSDPAAPTPYIPYDIVHDKTISCPETICTNIIKDSTIIANDTTFNLNNVCGAENKINSSDKLDLTGGGSSGGSSSSSITSLVSNNTVVIGIVVVVLFVLIILLIVLTKSRSNNELKKMILLNTMLNKKE